MQLQDVTVTNDGATILSLLDVEHPAGKILVDLAQQQDKEVSNSKTSGIGCAYCCSGRRWDDISCLDSSGTTSTGQRADEKPHTPNYYHHRLPPCPSGSSQVHE